VWWEGKGHHLQPPSRSEVPHVGECGARDPHGYQETSAECCRALENVFEKMEAFFKKKEIFLSFSCYKTYAFGLMQLVF